MLETAKNGLIGGAAPVATFHTYIFGVATFQGSIIGMYPSHSGYHGQTTPTAQTVRPFGTKGGYAPTLVAVIFYPYKQITIKGSFNRSGFEYLCSG